MQPGGRLEQFLVAGEGRGEAACASRHTLDMRPAAGKGVLQEIAGEVFGPSAK